MNIGGFIRNDSAPKMSTVSTAFSSLVLSNTCQSVSFRVLKNHCELSHNGCIDMGSHLENKEFEVCLLRHRLRDALQTLEVLKVW